MSLTPLELRRTLHCSAEPSFKEFETTRIIYENLSALSLKNGIFKIKRPFPSGLIAEYKSGPDFNGPFVLLRADIDALPMFENTAYEFSSNNGFMHACGHDVHTAVLYGFIKYVVENGINKNFIFFFQPAEETGGGAGAFLDAAVFDCYNISSAYALHVTDEYEEGAIASAPGTLFASAREVDIEIIGRAAHIASSSLGIDALKASRIFFDKTEKILLEYGDSLIFGAGKFSAGEVRNVVSAYARIEGSIRALTAACSDSFYEKLDDALAEIKRDMKISYTIANGSYYPEVRVDRMLYEKARIKLAGKYNFIECAHKFTGEDFGFIARRYPAFMFWLGCRKAGEEIYGLHNPCFLPPESLIDKGIAVLIDLLL